MKKKNVNSGPFLVTPFTFHEQDIPDVLRLISHIKGDDCLYRIEKHGPLQTIWIKKDLSYEKTCS